MRAMGIEEFGDPGSIKRLDLPDPPVGPDYVLIRVKAAGVNPVDAMIRAGGLVGAFPHFFPLVLGWDAAGVVEGVGPAVRRFAPGDEVYAYCRKDYIGGGTYGDLVAVRPFHVAHKPDEASWAEAGAVPLAGLTAFQVIHEALLVEEGQTVLIHGGAGGVGSFAVQFARVLGAHVIATGRAANHEFMRSLGAAETIDYTAGDFAEAVLALYPDGVDAVADFAGGDTLERSAAILREGSRASSILVTSPPDAFDAKRIGFAYVFVRPDSDQLAQIATLIDTGEVRVHVTKELPIEAAARAHELIETGHTRGKIVLVND
jgi:NADPH:quinone reductase-like Zn-dependent oxidoreductase